MKVLFDTNVVLDLLLERPPFAESAADLVSRVERGEITGYLCATTITTIYYLIQRSLDPRSANAHTKALLALFEIAPVNRLVLDRALALDFADFEDAVIHEAGAHAGAEYLVTRDRRGFAKATFPVYAPDELIDVLKATGLDRNA